MAKKFSQEMLGVRDGTVPKLRAEGAVIGGDLKRFRAVIALAVAGNGLVTQADNVLLFQLPAGYVPALTILNGIALGATAQIAVGTSPVHATNGQFRAAAIKNAAGVEIGMPVAAADDPPSPSPQDVFLTVGAADLPTAGTFIVEVWASAAA
jgi:hypothetical protein